MARPLRPLQPVTGSNQLPQIVAEKGAQQLSHAIDMASEKCELQVADCTLCAASCKLQAAILRPAKSINKLHLNAECFQISNSICQDEFEKQRNHLVNSLEFTKD